MVNKAVNWAKAQFYNLKDDLDETSDIAGEHPETVQEILEALRAWQQDVQADNS